MTSNNQLKFFNLKNSILVYELDRIVIRHIQAIISEKNIGKIYICYRKQSVLKKIKTHLQEFKNFLKEKIINDLFFAQKVIKI